MNGTFKISLKTPMGIKNGAVTLVDKNGVLTGSLRALGNEIPICNGKSSGNTFEFDGVLKTGFGKIEYKVKGTIIGNVLEATAKTKYGLMQIKGTRA